MVLPNKVFAFSGFSTYELQSKKERMVRMVKALGGDVDNKNFSHLISYDMSSSEKLCIALAGGKWILTFPYVFQSFHAKEWLNETDFEWSDEMKFCRLVTQIPHRSYQYYKLRSARKCREFVQSNPEGKGMLSDWKVCVCEDVINDTTPNVVNILEAGNATIVKKFKSKEDLQLYSVYWLKGKVTQVVVPSVLFSKVLLKAFRDCNIKVTTGVDILNYLVKTEVGDPRVSEISGLNSTNLKRNISCLENDDSSDAKENIQINYCYWPVKQNHRQLHVYTRDNTVSDVSSHISFYWANVDEAVNENSISFLSECLFTLTTPTENNYEIIMKLMEINYKVCDAQLVLISKMLELISQHYKSLELFELVSCYNENPFEFIRNLCDRCLKSDLKRAYLTLLKWWIQLLESDFQRFVKSTEKYRDCIIDRVKRPLVAALFWPQDQTGFTVNSNVNHLLSIAGEIILSFEENEQLYNEVSKIICMVVEVYRISRNRTDFEWPVPTSHTICTSVFSSIDRSPDFQVKMKSLLSFKYLPWLQFWLSYLMVKQHFQFLTFNSTYSVSSIVDWFTAFSVTSRLSSARKDDLVHFLFLVTLLLKSYVLTSKIDLLLKSGCTSKLFTSIFRSTYVNSVNAVEKEKEIICAIIRTFDFLRDSAKKLIGSDEDIEDAFLHFSEILDVLRGYVFSHTSSCTLRADIKLEQETLMRDDEMVIILWDD